eukprot:CAMPEP_0114511972 /NCGR_PEP_ID=MMETSP0109-20121206/14703_1 /TAXON_ID=29199 /ORGANISM="Chlorarachnion reptans, Strain CCCM449" /LENGTH=158 /DNA_ID=CAMNT_0001691577 /DNA_START=58 /DNA_END=534 /DNA_ORIENTATION=-
MSYGGFLRKWTSFRKHMKDNGLYETGRLYLMMNGWYREGSIVGKDKYGNTYYEQPDHPINGRHRWVEYSDRSDWDGSDVPAEWHMWLTRMTDKLPKSQDAGKEGAMYKWKKEHLKNTGSRYGNAANYVPPGHWQRGQEEKGYFNKQDKVQSWTPGAAK